MKTFSSIILSLLLLFPVVLSASGKMGEKYAFTPHITSAEGLLALQEDSRGRKKFALLIRVGSGSFPFLYVEGDPQKLHRWKGRNVKITGPLFWEKSMDRPTLRPERLEPAWRTYF